MSKANSIPRSVWTLRDIVLIIAAFVLLVGATGALALRDQWAPLGAFSDVPVSLSSLNTTDYHALAFDPRDPNIVYFGHHTGVMKSTDGGVTWSPVLRQGDAMSLVAMDNTVIMAGHEVFMRSDDDGGANWKPIATNLPDQDIHGFAVTPNNPNTFFAYIVSYGLWRSDDAGATWALVSKELPDTVLALAVVPTSPETVYAGTMDKGLLKSMDGGKTWQPANGFDRKMATTLAQDPRAPQIVFAGTESGLYRSNVDGTKWTQVALKGKDVATMAISRANPARLLVVDGQGRVYRSDDGGSGWKK